MMCIVYIVRFCRGEDLISKYCYFFLGWKTYSGRLGSVKLDQFPFWYEFIFDYIQQRQGCQIIFLKKGHPLPQKRTVNVINFSKKDRFEVFFPRVILSFVW